MAEQRFRRSQRGSARVKRPELLGHPVGSPLGATAR
jgi:hypothetical protein